MELWWAKRSLPPPSGVMNPKPFESLNHFTVPVAMSYPLLEVAVLTRLSEPRFGHDGQGRESTATWTPLWAALEGRVFTLEILRHGLYHHAGGQKSQL